MFVTISFWAMMFGAALAASESGGELSADALGQSGAGFGLSLLLVPVVFASAAFVSLREDAPIMTLAGMGVAIGVGLPLLILENPVAALISGYAAGAVVALSRPAKQPLRNRWIAAAVVALLVHAGFEVGLEAPTAWIAPALPFTAMGIADLFTDQTYETAPVATADEDSPT